MFAQTQTRMVGVLKLVRRVDTSLEGADALGEWIVPVKWKERNLATTLELYREVIIDLAERAAAYKQSDLRPIQRSMRDLVRGMSMQAYVEGMRDAGIKDAEDMLDDEDLAEIQRWLGGQLPHVAGFVRASYDGRPGLAGELLERIEWWVASLEALGNLAKAQVMRNKPVTWHFGDTQHCDTCRKLDGKRHRLMWFTSRGYIPRDPGSETLDCGGWRCQCGLYDDDGEQVM